MFSVAAEPVEKTSTFLTEANDIQEVRFFSSVTAGLENGVSMPVYNTYIVDINGNFCFQADLPSNQGLFQIDQWNIVIKPHNGFIYNLDESKEYSFTFTMGQDAYYSESTFREIADIRIGLGDSLGNWASATIKATPVADSDYQWTKITVPPNEIKKIKNISKINILMRTNPNIYQGSSLVSLWVKSFADIKVYDPEVDKIILGIEQGNNTINNNINISSEQINNNINNATNEINNKLEEGSNAVTNKIDNQTETQRGFFAQLGDRISGFFDTLLSGIINGLKSLFIPNDVVDPETGQKVSYFTQYFNGWNEWLEEHFGVLYFPFSILFDVLGQILAFSPPANPTITFPGLEIMGAKLLEPIVYDFSTFDMPWLNTAHDLYLFAVDAIIGFWLVRLAYKKLSEIMGGGS